MKWNNIPFVSKDPSLTEEEDANRKALEFDLQVQENGGPTVEETQRENEERGKR